MEITQRGSAADKRQQEADDGQRGEGSKAEERQEMGAAE
jgi:hypothetical protein